MSTLRKTLVIALALAVAASIVTPATAGKKKKKPKPYTSEEGIIAVPHTMLYATTSEVNSVTANEFEQRCEIPASNGLDAYVYEVPEDYRNIEADIKVTGKAQVAWDLYAFFYKEDCTMQPYSLQASGSVVMKDAEGIMPPGTHYVLVADFAGDPVTIFYELKPR